MSKEIVAASTRDQYQQLERLTRSVMKCTYEYFGKEEARFFRQQLVYSLAQDLGIKWHKIIYSVLDCEPLDRDAYQPIINSELWHKLPISMGDIPF